MSLDAGKLRHRLVLQRPVVTLDSDGAQIHTWEDVGTVWGSIEPISGREFVQSAAVQSQVTVRITLALAAGPARGLAHQPRRQAVPDRRRAARQGLGPRVRHAALL